jgi:two-component system, NarL family, response regulator
VSALSAVIRVLIVDDHPLMRGGISAMLAGHKELEVIGEAASAAEAVAKYDQLRPDVTLMDLQMGEGMHGIDAIAAIRKLSPLAKVIVLTTYAGDTLASRALRAGAQAYLLKSSVRKDLLETIHAVHAGFRRIDAEVASQLAQHTSDDALSLREVQVLELVALGNSNKQVAKKLSISETTAKGHVTTILGKLGANDRTHAVTLGIMRGIIQI